MANTQEQDFDKWVDQWEKAMQSDAFTSKKPTPKEVDNQSGFFGLWNQKDTGTLDNTESQYWSDVYNTMSEKDPQVLTEAKKNSNKPKKEASVKGGELPIKQKKGKDDPKEDYPPPAAKAKSTLPGTKQDSDTEGDVAKHFAKQMNPLQTSTKGKDALPRKVTPEFSCGKELVELNNMKKNLGVLESKLGSARALAKTKEADKLQKQIDDLWERLDKLSDDLSPDFLSDYLS